MGIVVMGSLIREGGGGVSLRVKYFENFCLGGEVRVHSSAVVK